MQASAGIAALATAVLLGGVVRYSSSWRRDA
jgi:hypothetical protein